MGTSHGTPRRGAAPSGERRAGAASGPARPAPPTVRSEAATSPPVPTPAGRGPAVRTSTAGVLGLQRAAGNAAVARLLATSPAQQVPQVQRAAKKAPTGVAKYGTTRLTDRLHDMISRGVLGVAGAPATLDNEQIFMLQGVANVETGGADNAVYTKDNMYVSLGFKQVTLGWGSLYDIINAVPGAFARHGIVLGGGTYHLKAGNLPAVEGAADPVALKTPPWTDRFFDAGAEDEVVSAMVAFTLKELGRMERRFAHDSPGKSNPWMKDPTARAWLLETMNNRPAYAYTAAKATLAKTNGQQLTRDAFLDILQAEILAAYEAQDERKKGEHIVTKIPRTAPGAAGPQSAHAAPSAPAAPAGVKAPGADLAGKAAAVLPGPAPGGGAGGALLHAIAAVGLLGPALRLLAALGHTDAAALTNLAFWAAHPDLFGTRLQPSQPGFAALAAEWTHLRDTVVRAAVTSPAKKPAAAPATPAAPVATRPAPGLTPAAEIAARSGASAPAAAPAAATTTSTSDKYITQNTGRYQDVSDSGRTAGQ